MTKYRLLCFFIPLILFLFPALVCADIGIQTQTPIDITLTGFDGLKDIALFQGKITKKNPRAINTAYRGLALLGFAGGQSYPLIIGAESFDLKITNPATAPTFSGSKENDFFYQSLADSKTLANTKYPFANMLLRAKALLKSSFTLKTLAQLEAKKQEMTRFVTENYPSLRHSDMIRRLMNQSFMMHEYVDYQVKGAPATRVQQTYQQAVFSNVDAWRKALSAQIPASNIVNASVAFYYNRSMVTLAAQMMDRFRADAICPGKPGLNFSLSQNLKLTDAQGRSHGTLAVLKGKKTLALVAEDCPVSMTAAVAKTRELARDKNANPLIVAPLAPLTIKYRAMAKMIRDEKILFIDDESWLQKQPTTRPQLPLVFENP